MMLPASADASAGGSPPSASPFYTYGSLYMRILVIDDDPSIGAAIQALLSRQACEVTHVETGRRGVREFEQSVFDAVIVDIFMPDMDGIETIQIFHQLRPAVPIVAMSGFRFRDSRGPAPDFLKMASALGASYCLRKPFTPNQLMASVNACIDRSPLEKHDSSS
jgi:DNA-binding response OmpR family regulator